MGIHIDSVEVSRLDVSESGRRRRWTTEEKLRIVGESLSGPRQVSATARRHGLSRSQLSKWRQQLQGQASPLPGRMVREPSLMPAVVVEAASLLAVQASVREGDGQVEPAKAVPAPPPQSSRMEIVVSNGRRVIVDAGVDAAALGRVLDVVERR
jgi:transposase